MYDMLDDGAGLVWDAFGSCVMIALGDFADDQ